MTLRERKDQDNLITAEERYENFLAGGYKSPDYEREFHVLYPETQALIQWSLFYG